MGRRPSVALRDSGSFLWGTSFCRAEMKNAIYRERERRSFRTPRAAARFFRDAKEQGFSPALVASEDGWEIRVWGESF